MTENWAFGGGPPAGGAGAVTLVEGSSFCISTAIGDLQPTSAQGLFFRDTRLLSRWELTLDGRRPEALTVEQPEPFSATFLCRTAPQSGQADSTLFIRRTRHLGDGMREDVVIENLSPELVACVLALEVEGDFADVFEVKENRVSPRQSQVAATATSQGIDLSFRSGGHTRGVHLVADQPASYRPGRLSFDVVVPPRGTWRACIQVQPVIDEVVLQSRHPCGHHIADSVPIRRLAEWRNRVPSVSGGTPALLATLRQCQGDLGVLRIFDPEHPERAVVAAGAPWFMTLFGRDSLLTAWMALPLSRDLALGTLQTLASFQGTKSEPQTEEQPGRILHEVRFGPQSTLALGGGNVYYGTADATPLFVMLLGELSRWGADAAHVSALLPHADRALDWIRHYGDSDGDGFVEYERATPGGLVNQGWKDSWDGVTHADGRIAQPPIALCEVQAYVYSAYVARADLARQAGDLGEAEHWQNEADRFRRAFHEAYWLPDRGYYALALDADKRPVDALASNMGHCLWTGIAAPHAAASVAAHLTSPDLFSGWGVRTLAASMGAFNPMSYHNGSVWPHDNAIIVAGLMRYGFVRQAHQVALSVLDAAEALGGRLPELFCGFDRSSFRVPVPYPTSCSPQAWAAAAPILVLRSLLRLDPKVPDGTIRIAPALPTPLEPFRLEGIAVGDSLLTIDVTESGLRVEGVADGITLLTEPDLPTVPATW